MIPGRRIRAVLLSILAAFLAGQAMPAAAKPPLPLAVKRQQLRNAYVRFETLIDALDIREGMTILDIGAGPGHASFLLAEKLHGTGEVFATDIREDFVRHIADEAKRKGLSNLVSVRVNEEGLDPFYGGHRYDLVLLSNVYHCLENRIEYFRELRGFLKPGARLVIVLYDQAPLFSVDDLSDLDGIVAGLSRGAEDDPFGRHLSDATRRLLEDPDRREELKRALVDDFNRMLADPGFHKGFYANSYFPKDFFTDSEREFANWLMMTLREEGVPDRPADPLDARALRTVIKLNRLFFRKRFGDHLAHRGAGAYIPAGDANRHTSKYVMLRELDAAGYGLDREIRLSPYFDAAVMAPKGSRDDPPPAPVPRTGQTDCYGARGRSVIDCAGTGQDGETRTGAAWPDPRFLDNGEETVVDRLTGLTWTRDADPAGGSRTWRQALDAVETLNSRNHLGHADWRLPNILELESLVNKQPGLPAWLESRGFRNVRADSYWTSSTYASYTACAWSVGMYSGIVAGRGKAEGGYVWPVRGGRSGTPALPKTGQAACHDDSGSPTACAGTGQDGALQAGADWPSPRFAPNGDRTVTDRLTGLVWSPDGDAPGPADCDPGTRKTGQEALDHVRCLNDRRYLGKSDWRLPNRNELASLVHRGQPDSAAWMNTQGFSNARGGIYWSSSSYPYNTWNAWCVNLHDGAVSSCAKGHRFHVWPVRGGR